MKLTLKLLNLKCLLNTIVSIANDLRGDLWP